MDWPLYHGARSSVWSRYYQQSGSLYCSWNWTHMPKKSEAVSAFLCGGRCEINIDHVVLISITVTAELVSYNLVKLLSLIWGPDTRRFNIRVSDRKMICNHLTWNRGYHKYILATAAKGHVQFTSTNIITKTHSVSACFIHFSRHNHKTKSHNKMLSLWYFAGSMYLHSILNA